MLPDYELHPDCLKWNKNHLEKVTLPLSLTFEVNSLEAR